MDSVCLYSVKQLKKETCTVEDSVHGSILCVCFSTTGGWTAPAGLSDPMEQTVRLVHKHLLIDPLFSHGAKRSYLQIVLEDADQTLQMNDVSSV